MNCCKNNNNWIDRSSSQDDIRVRVSKAISWICYKSRRCADDDKARSGLPSFALEASQRLVKVTRSSASCITSHHYTQLLIVITISHYVCVCATEVESTLTVTIPSMTVCEAMTHWTHTHTHKHTERACRVYFPQLI